MDIKKNKGSSHVAFFLSFMIFIIFIVLFVFMIQPSLHSRDKSRVLGSIRLNFFQNYTSHVTTTVSTYRIYNTSKVNPSRDCFQTLHLIGEGEGKIPKIYFENPEIDIEKPHTNLRFFDERDGGVEKEVWRQPSESTRLTLGKWDIDHLKKYGYNLTVRVTEEWRFIGNAPGGCPTGGDGDGEFFNETSYIIEEVEWEWLPEDQVGITLEAYVSDYEGLKESLNIPSEMDFAFNFTYSNGTTVGTEWNVPPGSNLYVEEYPIIYQDLDSNINTGILTIGVW